MKGGKAGRPRRGGTAGAKKKARPGMGKGSVKRGGTTPRKVGKAPREFGGFQTGDDDR